MQRRTVSAGAKSVFGDHRARAWLVFVTALALSACGDDAEGDTDADGATETGGAGTTSGVATSAAVTSAAATGSSGGPAQTDSGTTDPSGTDTTGGDSEPEHDPVRKVLHAGKPDLPSLWAGGAENGRDAMSFSAEARAALVGARWEGNVGELRNLVENRFYDDQESVEILVDLNAASWLQAVDPTTSSVDATVFADLITVSVR